MISWQHSWKRLVLASILALIMPIIAACGSAPETSTAPAQSTAPAAAASPAQNTEASPAASVAAEPAASASGQGTTAAASASGAGTTVAASCPEGFPNKPITFVTWSNPGGGGDVLGRAMITAIENQNLLSQPVVIENRAGGSGAVGMAHVVQQPANGYTVLIVTKNLTLTPLTQNLDTDYQDFKPIQRTQLEPFFVAVRTDSPWNSLKDLVAAAKTENVTFGGAFAGSTDNMMFSLLADKAGFELTYVPFESGGEAATALVGGTVDAISASPQEVAALVDAGKLKFLATPSAQRVPDFPDLPTFKDEGFDITLEQWRGFVYHKDVPDEIVECMDTVLRQASQDPSFQKYMEESGLANGYLPGDEFYALLEKETNENRAFLEEAGLLNQ